VPRAEVVPPPDSVDLDWRTLASLAAAVAGLVAVFGLGRSIPRTLAALAVSTILALGLDPLVSRLAARIGGRRGLALGAVLGGFVAAVALIAVLLVPPAARQARDLGDDLPAVLDDLTTLPVVGARLEDAGVPGKLQRSIEELPDRLLGDDTPLLRLGRRAADGLLAVTVTILFVVTLLLDGERLVRAVRRLVPVRHRDRADRLGEVSYRVVGKYVAGSLLVALVAGVCNLIAGLTLGVPLAPLLALWVMVWNLVPQIGGALGGIPFVLFGFTQGAGTGLACAAFFLVYQQLENNVLGPLLVGQAVKLSPPATMTAALVGVSAGGVVGALMAVPLLGAAKAIYLELRPGESVEDAEAATEPGERGLRASP
jgi:predicted PurR-regulated permease PerM